MSSIFVFFLFCSRGYFEYYPEAFTDYLADYNDHNYTEFLTYSDEIQLNTLLKAIGCIL